jgi:hypothetical protein
MKYHMFENLMIHIIRNQMFIHQDKQVKNILFLKAMN